MDKVGRKIVDTSGEITQGADSYISNILNMNKGQIQKDIAKLEEITGVPILDNVRSLKIAQRFSQDFPQTGSRTQDILRSLPIGRLLAGGLGGGAVGYEQGGTAGALAGAGAGIALTSPKVIGKAFTLSGKTAQELSGLAQKYPEVADFVKRLFGSSLK